MNRESLWQLIDVADVAVRVASYLRQVEDGLKPSDREALSKAIGFVTLAKNGGKFMSTGHLSSETSTLKPLNWAADIYKSEREITTGLDYKRLADYLAAILRCLRAVEKRAAYVPPDLKQSIHFFTHLGSMMSSEINQKRGQDRFELSH